MYEAAEAGIISALDSMHIFRQRYKDVVVGDLVDGYNDMKVLAKKAQNLLVRGRTDDIPAKARVSDYMDVFRELRDAVETLEASHDDLNAKNLAQVKDDRKFIIQTLVAMFGILVMLALGLWRIALIVP